MARARLFEQHPGEHVPKPVRGGIITLVIVGLLLYIAFSGGKIPFLPQGGFDVKAEFATGIDLAPGRTPIRVHGVNVGLVKKVQRTADGKDVIVTMHISNKSVHVKSDARAHVYWRTLLGFQYYIQLDPGVANAPLGDATIPLSHTSVQVEADQVLESLTPTSRSGIQQFFGQVATAFEPGNQAGSAIDATAPALRDVSPTLKSLQGTQPGDLSNTVYQASRLVTGLVSSEKSLSSLVRTGATAFSATGAQQASIASMLQQGPETLTQTQTTLNHVDTLLSKLDPVTEHLIPGVKALRPAEDKLDPTLRQLNPLLNTSRPTLVSLRPAVSRLAKAAKVGTPLLNRFTPTLDRLNNSIFPALEQTGTSGLKTYETIGPTISSVEASSQEFDTNGFVQRFQAVAGSANTLTFLPCSVPDLTTLKLDCSALDTVFGDLLGGGPGATSAAKTNRGNG